LSFHTLTINNLQQLAGKSPNAPLLQEPAAPSAIYS